MLRFLGKFQADFLLTNGWIEPLLVGGYAPFSPSYELISPDGAPDASYAYTVDLEKRSVTYEDLWTHKKDWLCDF